MSLVISTFLKVPFEGVLQFYNSELISRITKKNKLISISIAIAFSLVWYMTEKVMKPPKNLRHIPYLSYFDSIMSTLYNESLWNRASRVHLPIINNTNQLNFLEQTRYGWVLQVSNLKDAKQIFTKLDTFPKLDSKEEHKDTLKDKFTGGPNVLTLNNKKWRSQRMISNPAFRRSMPVKMFGNLTQQLFEVMETMDDTVDAADLMERWTLDAIGKAGFDFDFKAISDRDNEWVSRYHIINHGIRDIKYFFFPILDTKLRSLFPERVKVHKELEIFLKMLEIIIKKKKKALNYGVHNNALKENEKDLLTLLIESKESDEGVLNDEELLSNLCIFFFAGHDTTASTLSFAIHHLAQNQDIQQRAREEAIEILGDESCDVLPTIEDAKRMIYINQIVKETLRITGPVTRVPPRITTKDTDLSGIFIPKGTQLTVNVYNIQHSEKVWENPHKFNPDRFAEGGEASLVDSMGWIPFGSGPRQCIGMNFSMNEQRVLLSMLLRKFTWTTPENSIHKDSPKTVGINVVGPHNLNITFKKRY